MKRVFFIFVVSNVVNLQPSLNVLRWYSIQFKDFSFGTKTKKAPPSFPSQYVRCTGGNKTQKEKFYDAGCIREELF